MKKQRWLSGILVLALFLFALTACADNSAGSGSDGAAGEAAQAGDTAPATAAGDVPTAIKIGIINPSTGVLAGFGEGAPWTEELIIDYVNENGGIYFEDYGTSLQIEYVMYDSESDTTKCTELTQKLITDDQVDLIITRHTPETVNPVSAVAERFEVPCIALDAPVDAWLAEGPYEWTFHAFWNLDTMYKQYSAMWKQAGFGEGDKIGIIFANDADGSAWASVFRDKIEEEGYVLVDPGQYPAGTQDFSDIIQKFKDEGVQILVGTNTNPDFSTFWRQAQQLDFQPEFVTMGKAYLLESDALAIGAELMDGLAGEVWWSPTHPYTSSLTGATAADLTELYLEESGRKITQPMGYKYASLEVAVDALTRAANLEPATIRDAIAETNVDTIVGNISYNDDHFSLTPLVGGQWVLDGEGGLELVIVNNDLHPDIPTTGDLKPLR